MDDNQFSALPEAIGNLITLRTLFLNDNQLSELPTWMGNLTNLRSLFLDGNQLTELPREMANLDHLSWLHLNDNAISTLPPYLSRLNIQFLEIRGNPLVFPPESVVNGGVLPILDFLRHPRPYPPYEVNFVTIGTVTSWLILIFVSGFSLLRYLRWRAL